jgi:hypothetical protein
MDRNKIIINFGVVSSIVHFNEIFLQAISEKKLADLRRVRIFLLYINFIYFRQATNSEGV